MTRITPKYLTGVVRHFMNADGAGSFIDFEEVQAHIEKDKRRPPTGAEVFKIIENDRDRFGNERFVMRSMKGKLQIRAPSKEERTKNLKSVFSL